MGGLNEGLSDYKLILCMIRLVGNCIKKIKWGEREGIKVEILCKQGIF